MVNTRSKREFKCSDNKRDDKKRQDGATPTAPFTTTPAKIRAIIRGEPVGDDDIINMLNMSSIQYNSPQASSTPKNVSERERIERTITSRATQKVSSYTATPTATVTSNVIVDAPSTLPNNIVIHAPTPASSNVTPITTNKKTKRKKKAKTEQRGPHCLGRECRFNGLEHGNMLRCIFCYSWFHTDCTGADINVDGAWPCPSCRKMPETIKKLETKMQQLLESNTKIVQNCSNLVTELSGCQALNVALNAENEDLVHETKTLKDTVKNLDDEILKLRDENKQLREKTDVNSVEQNVREPENVIAPSTASAVTTESAAAVPEHVHRPTLYNDADIAVLPPDLLIGDSLIRDIISIKSNMKVITIRGATISDITSYLRACNSAEYGNITVVVGTNDCANYASIDQFEKQYRALLDEATRVAEDGTYFSSIPPRADDQDLAMWIPDYNNIIKSLCYETDCIFLDNDSNFTYANGTLDWKTLMPDGVHLSREGSKRLCWNLNLLDQAQVRNGVSHSPARSSFRKNTKKSNQYKQFHQQSHDDTGCYYCGEAGHTAAVCRHGKYIECKLCGQYGHKEKHHYQVQWA